MSNLKLQIAPHTLERAEDRGTTEDEIRDVIENGKLTPAKRNRLMKAKVYPYGRRRLGKYYKQKRVEVIYTVEEDTIVTVTVYVFFGAWEDR